MFKILVVDDDQAIRWSLRNLLGNKYTVLEAASAEEAIDIFQKEKIDLCLLDVNLPNEDGFALCQRIRQISLIPIIFITVNDDEGSLSCGLTCGGDDYVTKPFSYRELALRVMAHLRRSQYNQEVTAKSVVRGEYTLNLEKRTLERADVQIKITKTEFELLRRLMGHSGCLVTREMLLSEIWDIHENLWRTIL